MNILYVFLPSILALGLITSYQDIKFGKIRNKWIILALVYVILTYAVLIMFYSLKGTISPTYLAELGTNFIFTIMVGFGLWYFRIWTAGDGKLFIAYSALLPLSVYSNGYQKWIPSFTLLSNIFIPSLVIIIFLMFFKIRIEHLKKISMSFFKEFFHPKQLLNSILYLFAIFWIMQIALTWISLGNSYALKIILTMSTITIIQKKFRKKSIYIMMVIGLSRLVIDKSIYSLSFLIDMLILIFIWRLTISFLSGSLSKLGREILTKNILINQLKPGMVLDESIKKKEKITKQELNELNKQTNIKVIKYQKNYYIKRPKSHLDLDDFLEEEAEGLTQKQINDIKKIGIKKIKVSQTIPFAPCIFLGTILTIIANGNILILIMVFF
jgi:hypothetical protein